MNYINKGTKGGFADIAICFFVNIQELDLFLFRETHFNTDSQFQQPCLRNTFQS